MSEEKECNPDPHELTIAYELSPLLRTYVTSVVESYKEEKVAESH